MLFSFFFVATSCKSDGPVVDLKVEFVIDNVALSSQSLVNGLKKAKVAEEINCSDLIANYVKYKIDGGNFKTIPVFSVEGAKYTSSIQLPTGVHVLSEFIMYSNMNTPNDSTDDEPISAVPHSGSLYADYVTRPLNQEINVTTDGKNKFDIQVVCYTPETFESFGFVYYKITEIKIRQLYFFADFCIKDRSQYIGSLYEQQINWEAGSGYIDAPLIMKIAVIRNGVLQKEFYNSAQGEKIPVTYSDILGVTDNYEIQIFGLVRQGSSFIYKYFKSYFFTNISDIENGGDGVIDGVIGNCYDPGNPPDFVIAPWMNLPSQATFKITASPSVLGGYNDATLSGIPVGCDLTNGVWPAYCVDYTKEISINTSYNMDVYSTLYPDALPLFAKQTNWKKINWLFNNLDWYSGRHWYDVQGAIWKLLGNPWNGVSIGGVPNVTAISIKMVNDANTYGANYTPLPGGWAMVLFIKAGTPLTATEGLLQGVSVVVDP